MKSIYIYTDGSHLKKTTGRLGCGGIVVDPDGPGYGTKLSEFSEEINEEFLMRTFGTTKVSNPTAELLGVYFALIRFKIPRDWEVTVFSDYTGVKAFLGGAWKIKEAHIRVVCNLIWNEIKKQGLHITFEWIRGHQKVHDRDSFWNGEVDLNAKGKK